MALKFYDRTKEEATTTGTGTFSLSGTGADGGFRAFSAVHATGDEVFYCAVDSSNNAFEVGKGTLTTGTPWTLSRTEIKSSSNSNNKVNFAAAPEIFSTYPADNAAFSATDMASNVVETDAIFTDTLTADKALTGQFKGTLQFNKAYFTSSDYEVTSGNTLTVVDSADLYAVDISNSTVMDRTADFTSDTTITADTMFSPVINAYATVTINNGIKATVSPVGTTFVNNGDGISTGGPIAWKLPTSDSSDGTAIVTDGQGGLKVKGATGGSTVPTLSPQGETLIYDGDFNNYAGSTNYIEFIVPTSSAAATSDIESFRIEMDFVSILETNHSPSSGIFLRPMSAAGSAIALGTQSWNWRSNFWYNSSTSLSYRSFNSSGDSNGGSWSVNGGSYYGNTYGLGMTGGSNNYGVGSDNQNQPVQRFTSTDPKSQWASTFTGDIRIDNQIYAPRFYFRYNVLAAASTSAIDYVRTINGMSWYSSGNQTNNYPITGAHARGYQMYFLPYNYSYRESVKKNGGRIQVYAKLKQSQSQITLGQVA